METTLIWLLIFAGAAIGLLGLFLFASEKELKMKRREVELLSTRLHDLPEGKLDDNVTDQEILHSRQLTSGHEELSERVAALTIELQESRNKIAELKAAELHLGSMETEVVEMRGTYQRLLDENSQLRNQLSATEERLQGLPISAPELAEQYAQMEAEVTELRAELEKSMMQVRELENHQQIRKVESDQTVLERESLQARINELESELAAAKEKLANFRITQSQLSEMEQGYLLLDQENNRLREEIARCQEQLAETLESQHRLALVAQELEQLDLKHVALAQQHGQIQQEVTALRGLVGALPKASFELELSEDRFRNAGHPFPLHGAEPPSSSDAGRELPPQRGAYLNETAEDSRHESNAHAQTQPHDQSPHSSHAYAQRNGRDSYKLFVATIPVLLVAGTIAAGFLRKNAIDPDAPVVTEHVPTRIGAENANAKKTVPVGAGSPATEAPPPAVEKRSEGQVLASASYVREARVTTVAMSSAGANSSLDESRPMKPKAVSSKPEELGKTPPRAWGSYEIIRPVQVYSEPTENSQLVTKLDSGTQVNVVSARDGWFEIRSINGRPPGFIKSDSAVRRQ
jgi:hypothetical protein